MRISVIRGRGGGLCPSKNIHVIVFEQKAYPRYLRRKLHGGDGDGLGPSRLILTLGEPGTEGIEKWIRSFQYPVLLWWRVNDRIKIGWIKSGTIETHFHAAELDRWKEERFSIYILRV